jgi:hypothetical protein
MKPIVKPTPPPINAPILEERNVQHHFPCQCYPSYFTTKKVSTYETLTRMNTYFSAKWKEAQSRGRDFGELVAWLAEGRRGRETKSENSKPRFGRGKVHSSLFPKTDAHQRLRQTAPPLNNMSSSPSSSPLVFPRAQQAQISEIEILECMTFD